MGIRDERVARMARVGRGAVLLGSAVVLIAACGGPGASPGPTIGLPLQTGPASAGATTAPPTVAATPADATAAPAASIPPSGTWARLEIGGAPAAREDHTWTVDADGRIAYLFGGRGGGDMFGDLWAFDLAAGTWSRIEPAGAGPAPRFGHEAAWLSGAGLVVTLGQAGSRFFDDIWLFDPVTSAWRELPAAGHVPVARYGSCSGVGPDGRLWISHGFTEDGARFSDTAAYDVAAEAWTDVTPLDGVPKERCLHACWWTTDGTFALYGGQTTGVAALGDLWFLTPGGGSAPGHWAELEDPGPSARQLASVARRGPLTVVFGGRDVDRSPLADTWLLLDGAVAGLGFVPFAMDGAGPPARSGAAMVYDAATDRMLLFGGIGDGARDDLWALTFD